MSTVQMHMGDAHALAATYAQLRDTVRSSVGAMSPLVTEALALLDQPGQNPLNGPIPALSAVGADLLADRRDLEWRIEWLRSTDYISVATTGVSFTFEQDGDLLFNQEDKLIPCRRAAVAAPKLGVLFHRTVSSGGPARSSAR